MKKLLGLRPMWLFILYIVLDTICIGMGMGVPIFCILFGFIVGWFIVKFVTNSTIDMPLAFRKVLYYAIITAGFTLLTMLLLWGPLTSYLFDPSKDLLNTGIPMILYEPRASLIGWIVLMVMISPFLQLLTMVFSAYLTLLDWIKNAAQDQKAI